MLRICFMQFQTTPI